MGIHHILVIRFRRVGDTVLSTVICSSLRKTFPAAKIDYVLNENIADLCAHHPDIDRIITFTDKENHNMLIYLQKVRQVMHETKYDIIIDARSTIKTLFFSLFSLRTPIRIGARKNYNFLLHNFRVDNHKNPRLNVVLRNLMLLGPLESIAKVQYISDFKLYVTPVEKDMFRDYMQKQGINFSRPVILVAVSARISRKIWNEERMQTVLRKIIEVYDAQLIFNYSGEEEKNFALKVQEKMGKDPHIFTNIYADSLRKLCVLISNCHFFFGNEGGPRHISQAFGIPSYAIFPPGIHKTTWLPGEGLCYRGISPEDFCSREILEKMNYRQSFDLIDEERVWAGVSSLLSDHLRGFSM